MGNNYFLINIRIIVNIEKSMNHAADQQNSIECSLQTLYKFEEITAHDNKDTHLWAYRP